VFNDGTPFNAQAVVTTLQRDLTLPGSSRASDLSPIDTVTATEGSTVVIHLKTRFSPLTEILATVDARRAQDMPRRSRLDEVVP
jgi:peptide/nickel transport system substrate-binding protein